jgi:Ca2+-binding RTX toxin-like protein
MAYVTAYSKYTDSRGNKPLPVAQFYDADFYDNINANIYGTVYSDVLEVQWIEGRTLYSSVYAGNNITGNSNGVTGGQVNAYFKGYWTGSEWVVLGSIENISVSAKKLTDAAQTNSTIDDQRIIKQMFSGLDAFDLSEYNDVAYGYGGNDIFWGNGGKDKLFGGKGNDILNGGKGSDILNGGKGNDILYGQGGKDKIVFKDGYDKDKIVGFQNNKDTVKLDDNLWLGTKSVKKVLNQFGSQNGSDFVFDFGGGDILTIKNTTKSQLVNDVDIV